MAEWQQEQQQKQQQCGKQRNKTELHEETVTINWW